MSLCDFIEVTHWLESHFVILFLFLMIHWLMPTSPQTRCGHGHMDLFGGGFSLYKNKRYLAAHVAIKSSFTFQWGLIISLFTELWIAMIFCGDIHSF